VVEFLGLKSSKVSPNWVPQGKPISGNLGGWPSLRSERKDQVGRDPYWPTPGVWGVTIRVAVWWGKIKDPVAPSLPPPWTATRGVQPALVNPKRVYPGAGNRPVPSRGKAGTSTGQGGQDNLDPWQQLLNRVQQTSHPNLSRGTAKEEWTEKNTCPTCSPGSGRARTGPGSGPDMTR